MAAPCARKSIQIASASARVHLSRRSSSAFTSDASKLGGLGSCRPSSVSRVAVQKRSVLFSWLPKQLAGAQVSLMPLHTATSSALLTSLLSLHSNKWGCLSEGFATPL